MRSGWPAAVHLPQLCGEGLGLGSQRVEPGFGFDQQPCSALMGGHELIERGRPIGQPANRLLEARHQLLERRLGLGAQVTVAATRPRMPLTNRPASSPENVLASSIDSLIASSFSRLAMTPRTSWPAKAVTSGVAAPSAA